jgi:nucleotide-binding universal stress UspA family protein
VAVGIDGSRAAVGAALWAVDVAIIRGYDPNRRQPGWIVVEVDGSSASSGVLQRGFDEARLRGAPLRVLTTWEFTDTHDPHAVAVGNRLAQAQLDRRLAAWKKQWPDIEVKAVAIHGNTLNYLARNAESIQLIVVGHERVRGAGDLVGPPGYAALHNTDCSVLICEPQHAL